MVSIAEQAKNILQPLSEPTTVTAPRSKTPPIKNPTVILAGDDLQGSEDMLVEESAGDEEPTEIDRILNDLPEGVQRNQAY